MLLISGGKCQMGVVPVAKRGPRHDRPLIILSISREPAELSVNTLSEVRTSTGRSESRSFITPADIIWTIRPRSHRLQLFHFQNTALNCPSTASTLDTIYQNITDSMT